MNKIMPMRNRLTSNLLFIVVLLLTASVVTSCSSKRAVSKDDRSVIMVERKGDANKKLYKTVEDWLGTPYKYGGQSKDGVDCSGLVVEIYRTVYGKKLYRSSYEIYDKNCKAIKKKDLKEGDLVFFITSKNGKRINHVGLYLNDNKFVHSTTRKGVIITDLSEPYYERYFYKAGRVIF